MTRRGSGVNLRQKIFTYGAILNNMLLEVVEELKSAAVKSSCSWKVTFDEGKFFLWTKGLISPLLLPRPSSSLAISLGITPSLACAVMNFHWRMLDQH